MKCVYVSALFCLLISSAYSDPEVDSKVEGRGVRDMVTDVWEFFFGSDDYDYDDYNFDFNPNEVSSYTWYDPSSARRDTDVLEDEEDYSWGEVALGAALAIVPIGLLLAAFPAGLFTIAVKKRSFGDDNILDRIDPTQMPLLQSLQEGDLLSFVRPQCQRKLFCELSQLGKSPDASLLQKTFYYVSSLTPDSVSKRLRLQRLFELSRSNQCELFSCHAPRTSQLDSPSNHLQVPDSPQLDQE